MESFFYYPEYGMWRSIVDGPYVPMVASADSGGPLVPKEASKYSDEDIKKMEVDFKALGAIQMCLPNEVFHNFIQYKIAKVLWEALEKMFAGSEEVKENRRDILKQQYENFVRKEGESLTVLFNRTENFKTLKMSELYGMLKTYELEMIQDKERSPGHSTTSSTTTTSSALHSDHSAPSSTCAAVGTANFEHLCTQASIDKVGNSYKEKINCLKKEISSLKHEQTNLETQIDDLLVKLKATRAELADQKVHVDKYEFASKKLQKLLDAQIHEKVTDGLGFQDEKPYNTVPSQVDYVTIHGPNFNLTNLDYANQNLDPSKEESTLQDCNTPSESESTCSESTQTGEAPLLPNNEVILKSIKSVKVIQTNGPSPFIPSIPVTP
ncbi:hypothetical protein L1987_15214 [Smallanthus sonchifolius]|uniref:Uncharacterized protein n=1 Tax=Smallanthus sonchifolius TaxID=185202 RepID=A0ACB9J504_9ASTR|nr:hypothetical protein L1987_15214 [Smallanthus sonchifolius]